MVAAERFDQNQQRTDSIGAADDDRRAELAVN